MAKVQVLNVAVLDNPSPFGNPFQFEMTFECMEDLPEVPSEADCPSAGPIDTRRVKRQSRCHNWTLSSLSV
ncbi:UNVERIFIED_CONTAM: hypothetical protein FKN15_002825 [Acipenser sinensis]